MVNLNDFIQFYDNALDPLTCDYLINFYEENSVFQEQNDETKCFQLNLTDFREISEEFKKIHNELIQNVFNFRDQYYEIFDSSVFPDKHAFEPFKIQKFTPNNEEHFGAFVDVKDYSSARRFLCFTWFLNDNPAGQVEFLNLFIQPEKSKLVVYPPHWMYPYKKYTPLKEPQYILKTYLHYK